MYESFYGLNRKPFQTVPDPAFLYLSRGHDLALTMLRYGLMTVAPVTVITGEIGAGKTTLLRHLLATQPENLVTGLVSNMQTGRGQLLEWVMMAFGQPFEGLSHVRLFDAFQRFLVEHYAAGRRVLLVFDEAQNLDVPDLEELRLLSNINADGHQLLQLVLIGQPQLRTLLANPRLTQFVQRISADFHLSALAAPEVDAYIAHRLAVAGARWKIFPAETSALIHRATGGVPRLINTLCDLCLVYGFSAEEKVIMVPVLREFLDSARELGVYRQFRPIEAEAERPLLLETRAEDGPAAGGTVSYLRRGAE